MIKLLIFIFIASVTPGPNNILILSDGLRFGYKKTIGFNLGVCFAAFVGLFVIAYTGKDLTKFPIFNFTIAIFGSIYLLYLAYKLFIAGTGLEINSTHDKERSFMQAVILQFVNPKLWIFLTTTAFLLFPEGNRTAAFIAFISFLSIPINFFSLSLWALLGDKLKHWFDNIIFAKFFYWTNSLILVYLVYDIIKHFILPYFG